VPAATWRDLKYALHCRRGSREFPSLNSLIKLMWRGRVAKCMARASV